MEISRLTLTVAFFLVAAALHPHITRAQITAEKVEFPAHASSDLGVASIQLSGVIYYPAVDTTVPVPEHSLPAVVMLHGCSGMWSERNISAVNKDDHFALPGAPDLQVNIEKWGIKLAQSGIVALAVDSYTQRRGLPLYSSADVFEWQYQCADADTPWKGKVSPYTERVYDLQAGYAYLASRPDINCAKIASLGWSQGAQSTMVEAAVTTPSGGTRSSPTRFIRNVGIYPGCGKDLKFVPSPGTVDQSYWRPYGVMHLHVGTRDPFFGNCQKRANLANSLSGTTVVAFPPDYEEATHHYDSTRQTFPRIPAEAWPTDTLCVPPNECAMKRTDFAALAFLQTVL